MGIDGKFQSAVQLHREGRLSEAEALYNEVLSEQPTHFHALDLLGGMCVHSGRFELAAELLSRAIAVQPDRGRTHAYLGFALRRLGRPGDAVAALTRAAELGHSDAESLNSRGVALLELGQLEQAAADFKAALDLDPTMTLALMNLGLALSRLERHAEALERFNHAAALAPDDPSAWFRRGGALKALKRFDQAAASLERAIALDPESAPAHVFLCECLLELERREEGLASIDKALALAPDMVSAHTIRGIILLTLGRHVEALEAFDRALAIEPAHTEAQFNRSFCRLALGQFRTGWDDYRLRWRAPSFVRSSRGLIDAGLQARIDIDIGRADIAGRSVLVATEQGVGDVIMFASALPELLSDAGQVALLAERRLHRLFAASFPALRLLAPPADPAELDADVFLPMASLGRLYRNELTDFPQTPYLSVRPQVRAAWKQRLGPKRGLRIGLSWRGGTHVTRKSQRSMPLTQLQPLLDLPDCEFVSLQYGKVADEIAAWNAANAQQVWVPPPAEVADFEDLGGLVQELDVVVSVQTAIVHLAGALGVRTLVMAPRNPEWRYAASGSSMPWYGSVTVHRQEGERDWDAVVSRVVEAVRDICLSRSRDLAQGGSHAGDHR